MGVDGYLNLLKPPGMTSHDVVALVRARLGGLRIKRVGHLGTLDPAAAGVLPIAIGGATRLFQFAGGVDKAYRAEVVFGIATGTLDAEGDVVEESDSGALTEAAVRDLLGTFIGEIEQAPPAFSAARVEGRRLYDLAREGERREGRPKRVRIVDLTLASFDPGPRARALVDVVCEAGTYVRVLAAQIGCAAGCGAYLAFLVRTRAGRFELADSLTLEEFGEACDRGEIDRFILPPDWPLDGLPAVQLSAAAARAFAQGTCVRAAGAPAWPARIYGEGGCFLGLGEVVGDGQVRPRLVLAGLRPGSASPHPEQSRGAGPENAQL